MMALFLFSAIDSGGVIAIVVVGADTAITSTPVTWRELDSTEIPQPLIDTKPVVIKSNVRDFMTELLPRSISA